MPVASVTLQKGDRRMHCSGIERPLVPDPTRACGSSPSSTEPAESFADLVRRATPAGATGASAAASPAGGTATSLGLFETRPASLLQSELAPTSLAAPAGIDASEDDAVQDVSADPPLPETITRTRPPFDTLLAFWKALTPEIQASLLSLPLETQTQLATLVLGQGDNAEAFWTLLPAEIQTQFSALPEVLKAHLGAELGHPWLNLDDPSHITMFRDWLDELFHAGKLGIDFFKGPVGGEEPERTARRAKGDHDHRHTAIPT
jgi:hypothetical protein